MAKSWEGTEASTKLLLKGRLEANEARLLVVTPEKEGVTQTR